MVWLGRGGLRRDASSIPGSGRRVAAQAGSRRERQTDGGRIREPNMVAPLPDPVGSCGPDGSQRAPAAVITGQPPVRRNAHDRGQPSLCPLLFATKRHRDNDELPAHPLGSGLCMNRILSSMLSRFASHMYFLKKLFVSAQFCAWIKNCRSCTPGCSPSDPMLLQTHRRSTSTFPVSPAAVDLQHLIREEPFLSGAAHPLACDFFFWDC